MLLLVDTLPSSDRLGGKCHISESEHLEVSSNAAYRRLLHALGPDLVTVLDSNSPSHTMGFKTENLEKVKVFHFSLDDSFLLWHLLCRVTMASLD